ncbi:flagellar basal body P-ring protein FlgI [Buchnera aphidicola]
MINFTYAAEYTIKNLTHVSGSSTIPLMGYGLMVGLPNSGDRIPHSSFTLQTMLNLFKNMGLNIKHKRNIQTKNVAAVIVTAELPEFNYIGQKIPIYVSSIGNAQNLQNGTLLMTPLKDVNGIRYGTAQGHASIIHNLDNEINDLDHHKIKNNVKILNGAIIEKTYKYTLNNSGLLQLRLNSKNFNVAQKISDCINKNYPNAAYPLNSKIICIKVPKQKKEQIHIMNNILHFKINIHLEKKNIIFLKPKKNEITLKHEIYLNTAKIIKKHIFLNIHNIRKTSSTTSKTSKHFAKKIFKKTRLTNIIHALKFLNLPISHIFSILKSLKNKNLIKAQIKII